MTDSLAAVAGAFFFAWFSWKTWSSESWTTQGARERCEHNPSRFNRLNYRLDIFMSRRVVPLGLAALALFCLWEAFSPT